MGSGRIPATYSSQGAVGLNRTLMSTFFSTTLSNITITTNGKIYTSTATTAAPVNTSHDGMSLDCTDSSNVITVSIHIKKSKYNMFMSDD